MSYKDDIERINTAYYREINPAALKAELKNLGALLDGGELSKENAENAEALYCRLYLKLRLTQFFDGLDDNIYEELTDYLRTEYSPAEKKGYKKTCAVMKSAEKLLADLKPVCGLIYEAGAALNAGAELSSSVISKLEKAKGSAKSVRSPFGGDINFIDAGAIIAGRLEKILARANERKVCGLEEKIKRVVKEFSGKFLLYEYFPLPDRDATDANVQVIRTPLADEARLYAVRAADKKLYELDAVCLESISEDSAD
ncbi:MAG: hypothetical protein K2N30_03840, partial [Clostridia bacterium]|nr:hypothetical protein [Clostridia bacterium]